MRLIIADDSLLFREGIERLLAEWGFEVVAQTGETESLLHLVDKHNPDVVILDIRMPPSQTNEGLIAAERIRARHPEIGIVLLSHHVETHHAARLLAGGASGIGYLLKDRIVNLEDFRGALQRVAAGGSAIDPQLVSLLVGRKTESDLDALSSRERVVLSLIAEGRSNSSISAAVGVSAKTIEAHIRTIYQKLHLEPGEDDHRRVLAVLSYLQT